jgi:hypothetical protein
MIDGLVDKLSDQGVLGIVLSMCVLGMIALYLHARSLTTQLVAQRVEFQGTLKEVLEARIVEARASAVIGEKITSTLLDFGRSLETRGQAIDRMAVLIEHLKIAIETNRDRCRDQMDEVKGTLKGVQGSLSEVATCCTDNFKFLRERGSR